MTFKSPAPLRDWLEARLAPPALAAALSLAGEVLASPWVAPSPAPSPSPWVAPLETVLLKNPLTMDGRTVDRGRRLYQRHCVPCHAADGVGDGRMAVTLGYRPANLSLERTQQQEDGEIFWKISKGRSPMPDWEKQMSARERWDVVNYVRTLLRKAPRPTPSPSS